MHILLVGNYWPLVKVLKQGLQEEGYRVEVTPDGDEECRPFPGNGYDAIVLDLMGSLVVGQQLLHRWRRAGLQTPVVVLAAPTTNPADGFNRDRDCWLTKPFALEDLLARLRAITGWQGPVDFRARLTAGDWALN